ncbi:MAG: hypothetical protein ACRDGJ_03785 [Candidatus Limnocylindria bacterium]
MSRSRRSRGRPYQPLPPRRPSVWLARALVFVVGASLLLGTLVYVFGR